MFHLFFSQYKWSYEDCMKCPYWLRSQLVMIIEEAKDDLSFYIDYDEIKMFKGFRRFYKMILPLFGVKPETEAEKIERETASTVYEKNADGVFVRKE